MNTNTEDRPTKVNPSIMGITLLAAIVSVFVLIKVINSGGDTLRLTLAGAGSLVFVSLFLGVLRQKIKSRDNPLST